MTLLRLRRAPDYTRFRRNDGHLSSTSRFAGQPRLHDHPSARRPVNRTAVGDLQQADGLAGEEGAFLLCTFWLAEAFALLGDTARARKTFEPAVRHANDLGLLSEEVHSATGELIGNFPQAFSHIGLVNAAWAISQAEGGATG